MFDYLARQKVGGTHLTYSYLKQIPVLPPTSYEGRCPWGAEPLGEWLARRVVELQCTSHDLRAFAQDCSVGSSPFGWDEEHRFQLRCELDAAFFHLYRVDREDVDHIMDTFPIVRREDERTHGSYRSKEAILDHYDRMAHASGAPAALKEAGV